MTAFDVIYALIFAGDVAERRKAFKKNIASFAKTVGARVVYVNESSRSRPGGETEGGVIAFDFQAETDFPGAAGVDRFAILEHVDSPVLVIPAFASFGFPAFDSIWVPMSGEKRESTALKIALQAAEIAKTPVDLVHVTKVGQPCTCEALLEKIGDQFHHEYAKAMDKLVAEGSPLSPLRQRKWVRGFFHCTGDIPTEINNMLTDKRRSLLVLEWQGTLMSGRARILKRLLRSLTHPVLFTKVARRPSFRLKVAGEFRNERRPSR